MNRLLEVIYYDYAEKEISENQFETPEIRKAVTSFAETYFSHMSEEEQDKAFDMLTNLHKAIEKNCFEVGFYAGVKLLMGGVQS